jgi:hypothetical protein
MPLSDEQLEAMTPDELLILVLEEAGETIQACTKAMRFGLDGHHPDRPDTSNLHELCAETEQLATTVRILKTKCGVPSGMSDDLDVAIVAEWLQKRRTITGRLVMHPVEGGQRVAETLARDLLRRITDHTHPGA